MWNLTNIPNENLHNVEFPIPVTSYRSITRNNTYNQEQSKVEKDLTNEVELLKGNIQRQQIQIQDSQDQLRTLQTRVDELETKVKHGGGPHSSILTNIRNNRDIQPIVKMILGTSVILLNIDKIPRINYPDNLYNSPLLLAYLFYLYTDEILPKEKNISPLQEYKFILWSLEYIDKVLGEAGKPIMFNEQITALKRVVEGETPQEITDAETLNTMFDSVDKLKHNIEEYIVNGLADT
jgi:hypothetical protein